MAIWQKKDQETYSRPVKLRTNYKASARILQEIKITCKWLLTFTCARVFTLDHLHRLHIHRSGVLFYPLSSCWRSDQGMKLTFVAFRQPGEALKKVSAQLDFFLPGKNTYKK
jgi:hypothetical protein